MSGLSAMELIKRFREGKPTSREDRESSIQNRGLARKMWWEEGGSQPYLSKSIKETDFDDDPQPREFKRDIPLHYNVLSQNSRNLNENESRIEREIRDLQRSVNKTERDTNDTVFRESFLRRSNESIPFDRFDFSLTNRSRGGNSNVPVSTHELKLNHSTETLASTGILGLLKADLKLDGLTDGEEKNLGNKRVEDLNGSLEELLKQLHQNQTEKFSDENLTIPEITNKLGTEIIDLLGRYEQTEKSQKEQQAREEKLREEGREEERKKKILETLDKSVELNPPPLQFLSNIVPADMHGYPPFTSEKIEMNPDAANLKENLRILNNESLRILHTAMENELSTADEIFLQMRNLRNKLAQNMKKLDQMHRVRDYQPSHLVYQTSVMNRPGFFFDSPNEKTEAVDTKTPPISHPSILTAVQMIHTNLNSTLAVLEARLPVEKSTNKEIKPGILNDKEIPDLSTAPQQTKAEELKEAIEEIGKGQFDPVVERSKKEENRFNLKQIDEAPAQPKENNAGSKSNTQDYTALSKPRKYDGDDFKFIDSILGDDKSSIHLPKYLSFQQNPFEQQVLPNTKYQKFDIDPLKQIRDNKPVLPKYLAQRVNLNYSSEFIPSAPQLDELPAFPTVINPAAVYFQYQPNVDNRNNFSEVDIKPFIYQAPEGSAIRFLRQHDIPKEDRTFMKNLDPRNVFTDKTSAFPSIPFKDSSYRQKEDYLAKMQSIRQKFNHDPAVIH